jgi:MoxR-like ATPase
MNDKYCNTCGAKKPLGDFTKLTSSYDGHAHICRECAAKQRAAKRAAGAAGGPYRIPKFLVRPIGYGSVAGTIDPTATTEPQSEASPEDEKVIRKAAKLDAFIQPKEVIATWAAVQLIVEKGGLASNLLFKGPSGCGKSESAEDLARRAGLPFYKIDAPSITDPEAWFGTREVIDGEKGPVTVYHESLFAKAIQTPCVLLIDEVNRVSDAVRQIILGLTDKSRQVTNPLTGLPLHRDPKCFIIMTANVGLAFTGTYAIDPAFLTRSLTTNFGYLDKATETALAVARHGVAPSVASLFVRFADETRQRAKSDEDFPPISTREVLAACELAAQGLDLAYAAHQAIINGASEEGAAESVRAALEFIWKGIATAPASDESSAEVPF